MPSLPTLAKVAGCGALMVAGAFSYTQWKIEEGLKRSTWYSESLRLLRAHHGAASLLGEPIVDGRLDLGSNDTNFCDQTRAQFRVPVRGPKQKGHLYLWASRAEGEWTVDRLELELAADANRKLLVHSHQQQVPQSDVHSHQQQVPQSDVHSHQQQVPQSDMTPEIEAAC